MLLKIFKNLDILKTVLARNVIIHKSTASLKDVIVVYYQAKNIYLDIYH